MGLVNLAHSPSFDKESESSVSVSVEELLDPVESIYRRVSAKGGSILSNMAVLLTGSNMARTSLQFSHTT